MWATFDREKYESEDWPVATNPEVALTGSYGSWEWKLDKSIPYRHEVWIAAVTRGNIYAMKQFEINVCSAQSIQLTSLYKKFVILQPQYASNIGKKGNYLINYKKDIVPLFDVFFCPYCKERIKFHLINADTGLAYTGNQVSINENFDVVINSNLPVHDFNLKFRVSVKHDSLCNFIDDLDLEFDIEICGYE